MLELAHFLHRMLHIAAPYLIGLAVILWALAFGTAALRTWRQPLGAQLRQSRIFTRAAVGFLVIVLSLCGASAFVSWAALVGFRPRLDAAVTEVYVDGRPAANSDRLLSALREIKTLSHHHSHPTTVYRVRLLTSEGPLELVLRRDSSVPNEYWVFYSAFDEANGIGTVVTDALD